MTPDREKELVEACNEALLKHFEGLPPLTPENYEGHKREMIRAILTAARPLIAREATEKVLRDLYSEVREIRDLLRKAGKYEVKCLKWKNLMTRYENYATEHNIPLSQEGK